MEKEKVLILIPVKENSKRLPNKNFLKLNGIEIWRYAYQAAYCFWQRNGIGSKLLVCSEGTKATKFLTSGVYLRKPKELSEDPKEIVDTCLWVLDMLPEKFTTLIMVQPSNPFVKEKDIDNCYKLFLKWKRTTVRSVMKLGKTTWRPCDWMYSTDEMESQQVITAYSVNAYIGNGSIVIIDTDRLKLDKTLASMKTIPYEMGGVDIDTKQDFLLAKMLMEENNK